MRKSMLAAAVFAVLGAASLVSPAAAVPAGPAVDLAASTDLVTDVRMHRGMRRGHMMRHHRMHHRRTMGRKKGL